MNLAERSILRLPAPLYLAPLLTGGDHLHFGYFQGPADTIPEAQENMMRLNLFFLPSWARTALDAGCGIGATARELASRGLEVTAVCPDGPMLECAREITAARNLPATITWHHSTFEAFPDGDEFDFVLFQESFQYLDDLGSAVRKLASHVRPGGRAVVADQFLSEARPRDLARFHHYDGFLERAGKCGLSLLTSCDITPAVGPTMDRFLRLLEERGEELVQRYQAEKPAIVEDIQATLRQGYLERDGAQDGLLSYRIVVLDKVGNRTD
jgi:SAM-dependent methyltransferase